LPLQKDILEHSPIRLSSRNPIWRNKVPKELIEELWKKRWGVAETRNKTLVTDPTIKVPGWDLTRAQWTILNYASGWSREDVTTYSINGKCPTLNYANAAINYQSHCPDMP
jgi:hypothetical protein